MPSGKLREGEPLQLAAHRELKEKLGFDVPKLNPSGVLRVSIRKQGTIITDFVGFLFKAPMPASCVLSSHVKWHAPSDICGNNMMPGTYELLQALSGYTYDQDVLVDIV